MTQDFTAQGHLACEGERDPTQRVHLDVLIAKIEVVRRGDARRSKLYYIREKVNREIKRQMRRMSLVSMATESGAEAAAREAEEVKRAEEEAAKAAEAECRQRHRHY